MGKTALLCTVAVLTVWLTAFSAWAQDPDVLYVFESAYPESVGWFGFPANPVGDVNNDGFDDIGIGATMEDVGAQPEAGRAYVFSGATGGKLFSLTSPRNQNDAEYGFIEGIGDVNNDDHDDFVVTAWREDVGTIPEAGRVYVYSGDTGDTLYSFTSPSPLQDGRFGCDASAAGDWNDDNCPDIIVGAYWEIASDDRGRAYIFDGSNGACLDTLTSPNGESLGRFGFPTKSCGDVNSDGTVDVLVGAHREDPGSNPTNSGMAYVFSGGTGDLIHELSPPNPVENGRFGYGAAGAGDVNGDGYSDIIVGEYGGTSGTGSSSVGRAHVYNGLTGELLYSLDSQNPEYQGDFGAYVSGVSDWDGDGCDDIIVGAHDESYTNPDDGFAYIFSGATSELMFAITSPGSEPEGLFGIWVSDVSDMNADGFPDVAVSSLREDGGAIDAGRVYVFSLMQLDGSVTGGELVLNWSTWPSATQYWVYGADNTAYFEPGLVSPYQHRLAVISPGTTTWSSANGVGDPDHNWTYLIVAAGTGFASPPMSNRTGGFDYITLSP